jgi:hypothetical protein
LLKFWYSISCKTSCNYACKYIAFHTGCHMIEFKDNFWTPLYVSVQLKILRLFNQIENLSLTVNTIMLRSMSYNFIFFVFKLMGYMCGIISFLESYAIMG